MLDWSHGGQGSEPRAAHLTYDGAMPGRQRRRRVRPVAALVAIAATAVANANAFPSSRLIYARGKGTEQCPDEDFVRAEVATRLGYDPFFVWAERTIVAQVSRALRGFQATVQLLDAKGVVRGSRALSSTSGDCTDLVKAVALAISIGIDPEAASGPPPASSSERAVPPPEASAPVPPSEPPVAAAVVVGEKQDKPPPASSAAPRIAPEVGAGVWSAINLAPAISVGGALFGGANWGPALLLLELRQNLQASANGIGASLLSGAFLPCGRYQVLFACANATLGQLRFQGARSANATYIALGGRAGVDVPVFRQIFLRAHVEVMRSLDQTLVFQDGFQAWQLPAVSGALGLQAAMRF